MNQLEMSLEPLRGFLISVGEFLPRIVLALLVLLAGWIIAKMVRFAIARGLRAVNFTVLTERAGMDGFLRDGGIQTDTAGILALLFYWLVILASLIIGFNLLGLTYITDLLGRVVLFLPKVMVALLILAFGAYFARFIGNAVTRLLPQRPHPGRRHPRPPCPVRDRRFRGAHRARPGQRRRRHRAPDLPHRARGRGPRARARVWPGRQGLGRGDAGALVAAQEVTITRQSLPFGAELLRRRRRALSLVGARREHGRSQRRRQVSSHERQRWLVRAHRARSRRRHALPLSHRRRALGARSRLALPARGRWRPERGDRPRRIPMARPGVAQPAVE